MELLCLNVFHQWNFSRGLSVILCLLGGPHYYSKWYRSVACWNNLWPGLTEMCPFPSFCMSPFELQNKHIYIYGVEGEMNLLALQLVTGYPPSPIRIMLGLRSSQQPRVLMHGVSGGGDSNGSLPTWQTLSQKPSALRFPRSITHNKLWSLLSSG